MQEVVAQYPGRVRFVSENFGASKLAERFGVTRYPAVFVDDVLVARPRDFGFFGQGDSAGRYAPWRDAANQARFKKDLTAMVERALAGRANRSAAEPPAAPATSQAPDRVAALPEFHLTDLAGGTLSRSSVAGKVVAVEFWATWCPPCRSTLAWLGDLRARYGDRLTVVALAVESPEAQIRSTVAEQSRDLHWAIADAATAAAFGDVVAVPTLLLFDAQGKSAGAFYGAPPDLHTNVEAALAKLLP